MCGSLRKVYVFCADRLSYNVPTQKHMNFTFLKLPHNISYLTKLNRIRTSTSSTLISTTDPIVLTIII